MRFSLRFKLNFFIALVMVVTASAIMYLTHRDVVSAIFESEESSAQNVLQLVELNIKGNYQKLLKDRIGTLKQRKARLKSTATNARLVIRDYQKLAEQGVLAENLARQRAIDWIKTADFGDEYIFIFDSTGKVIYHPLQALHETSLEELQDMKTRRIVQVMGPGKLRTGGAAAVFSWTDEQQSAGLPQTKQLGHFLPLKELGWTVAAVIDIDDIETNAQKQLDTMIKVLRRTFADIRVASTGAVFVFDNRKQLLVPPANKADLDYSALTNIATGNLLLDDLIATAATDDPELDYIIDTGSDNQTDSSPKQEKGDAFVSFFRSLKWYIVVQLPHHEIQGPAKALILLQSLTIAAIFLASLIAAFLLVARITRPMNMLANYAKDLPGHDFTASAVARSPIDDLPQKYKDEVGHLASSLLFMRKELTKNVLSLMKTTRDKERIESELNIAREIQLGILPKTFPAFPDLDDFDLFATLNPAKEVGGDLYDFFLLDDDHICFTLGDVSDKGVPAALFMVITRTLINIVARRGYSPGEMMTRVNNVLSIDNPRTMFVTLLIGKLNIRTGEIQYANGGHNSPVLIRRGEKTRYLKPISGPVVGAMEDIPYKDLTETLTPGDAIFLYTDGVTEAMDSQKEIFSDEKLLTDLDGCSQQPVDEVISCIMESIRTHAGEEPQSDDIAMMMIRYNGK